MIAPNYYESGSPRGVDFDFKDGEWEKIKTVVESAPYNAGDVVYVGGKGRYNVCKVDSIDWTINGAGRATEAYWVRRKNKSGEWSLRLWLAKPEYIRAGYALAIGIVP
jgi:hypothetical protein